MYGMLQIQKIDFIKAIYDDSLSHKIFSIANIQFTNAPAIMGALLYWKRNMHPKKLVNRQGEFKFFFEEDTPEFYASVKYPAHTDLTEDQRRELAFLLLEERGTIGSYSLMGHPKEVVQHAGIRRYNIQKGFEEIDFPEHFDGRIEPSHVSIIFDELHLEDLHQKNPHLSKDFLRQYIPWRAKTVQQHPEEFEAYLDYIDFRYIVQMNEQLSEFYLVKHIDRFRPHATLLNPAVHRMLSRYFLQHFQIDTPDSAKEVADFRIVADEEQPDAELPPYEQLVSESPMHQMSEDYVALQNYEHFEFYRGRHIWPGSEHLVKGIPSFAAQRYTKLGYKKLTNSQMDLIIKQATPEQLQLLGASLELHWLHRYKELLDWHVICQYNMYLNGAFLTKHKKYVDFEALRQNIYARIDNEYIVKNAKQIIYGHEPIPMVLRCIDEQVMLQYGEQLVISEAVVDEMTRYTSYIRMKMILYLFDYEHYNKPLYMFYPLM